MAYYTLKNWKNRDVEHPGRRTITDVISGTSQTVDVVRSEGEIYEPGDAFISSNLNDLEGRIGSAFLLVDGAKLNKPSNTPANNQVVKYVNGSIVWANEAGGGGTVYQDYTDITVYGNYWTPLPDPSPIEGAYYKNEIELEGLVEGQSIVTIVPSPEMIANEKFFPLVGVEDDKLILYATDDINEDFAIPLVSVRTINEVTP